MMSIFARLWGLIPSDILVFHIIIIQGINKESDISKARATRGCCPDMCPERERYIREERRRVHVYEMVPGTESVCILTILIIRVVIHTCTIC